MLSRLASPPGRLVAARPKRSAASTSPAGRLVCLDFLRPRPGRPGGMRFLFDCGVFDDAVLDTVVIQPAEIAESRVLPLETALPLLSGPVRRRVRAACESKQVRYLEDGRPVEGIRS